jgi:hypothetical protein
MSTKTEHDLVSKIMDQQRPDASTENPPAAEIPSSTTPPSTAAPKTPSSPPPPASPAPSKPPTIVVHSAAPPPLPSASHARPRPATAHSHREPGASLQLTTPIPTGSLDDLLSPERMKFSNRGSIIMDGSFNVRNGRDSIVGSSSIAQSSRGPLVGSRVLSADETSLSAKVRSLYEHGGDQVSIAEEVLMEEEEEEDQVEARSMKSLNEDSHLSHQNGSATNPKLRNSPSRLSQPADTGANRSQFEAAGGIEDFEDVKGDEIDRYGFIVARTTGSRGSHTSGHTFESNANIQRVTTSLLDASNTPRKRASVLRRMPSRSSTNVPSRQTSRRSLKPQPSIYSQSRKSISTSQSSLHSHFSSKERKLVIDAGDMLTLPPGAAADRPAGTDHTPVTRAMREKEWEREGKWKKMGRLKPGQGKGGGMQFEFDPTDPKVVSRTWKGIPDRWRGMAWYSFLDASAKKSKISAGEDELFQIFYELQSEASADDVQIDCDVPRTINRHIMFRKRYRGGQRLLFRVLHALSLYFPEVGYVQGMAALAATLLCYYDEEHAFVMMVRLWQLRGLERLYQSGFEGLMDALGDFEKYWLASSDVAKKLVRHSIYLLLN